jgi:nucleotide-binding universal stress UspA family protein
MYTNIVVGVDHETGGRDAIALARELLADGGAVTLAYVHSGYPMVGRGASPAYEAAERTRAVDVLETARNETGVDAELRPIGAPSVGGGLHRLAETLGADLLVVGSTRRSRLGRVLLGDDAAASLDGAPCAVAIAPAGYAEHPKAMREIGVAYDESAESAHALEVARGLALESGAKLSAFEALEVPVFAYPSKTVPLPYIAPTDEVISATRERIAALGEIEPHVVYGVPGEELALYSASVDLLVIGSRGYGPVGRLVHGSTTRHLMRHVRCPLLAITKTARATDETGAAELAGAASE